MTRIVRGGFAAVILLIAMSACNSAGATGPGSAAPGAPVTSASGTSSTASSVMFTRSGGLVGARDRVVINPDGTWIRTDRAGTKTRGQLSADQIAQLQRLANDPDLGRESSSPTANVTCADGRTYSVNVGHVTVTYTDCSTDHPEIAGRIVGLLTTWTLR